jgi:hypothetical protein
MSAGGHLQCSIGIVSGGYHEFPNVLGVAVRPTEVNPDACSLQAESEQVSPQVIRSQEQGSGLDLMREYEAKVSGPQSHEASGGNWGSSSGGVVGGEVRRSSFTKRWTDATT